MKNLITYINESFQSRDIDIEALAPEMKDVARLKSLIKKYDKIGKEIGNTNGDLHSAFINNIKYIAGVKKADTLEAKSRDVWAARGIKTKQKKVYAYANALFSAAKSAYNKDIKNSGWANPQILLEALLAAAEHIIEWFGDTDVNNDKILGKLIAAYEETSKLKLSDYYTKQKDIYVSNRKIYDFEVESIMQFKNDFKNHKFVYFADTDGESMAELVIVPTEYYESIDDALPTHKMKTVCFRGYDIDKLIKEMVNKGKMQALSFCYGTYHFGKSDSDDTTVCKLGYLDKLPKDIYKVGYGYGSGIRYRGKIYEDSKVYTWSDSLWNVYNK